jgi:hypothetical protein
LRTSVTNKQRVGGWAVTLKSAGLNDIDPERLLYNPFARTLLWEIRDRAAVFDEVRATWNPYREVLNAWYAKRSQT